MYIEGWKEYMPGIIVYAEQNQKNSKYKAESSIYNTNENPRLKICFHKNLHFAISLNFKVFWANKGRFGIISHLWENCVDSSWALELGLWS